MNTRCFIRTGLMSGLLVSTLCLADESHFAIAERLFLAAQSTPAAAQELDQLCQSSDDRELQAVVCVWAGRQQTDKAIKKAHHQRAEDQLAKWNEAEQNSAQGLLLQAQLLMYQMDYRGTLFQVTNGNRLGALTFAAEQAAPEDERAQLLRAIFELSAPKIAGGDAEAAQHALQRLSQSENATIRFDAALQLCGLQSKTERQACEARVYQTVADGGF